MLIGDRVDTDRAIHRHAASTGFIAATVGPWNITFSGWELAEHPWPSYQRGDAYRLRATCHRMFLYRCAYRDETTWHLPDPVAIFTKGKSGDPMNWPRERPYWSLSWCIGSYVWSDLFGEIPVERIRVRIGYGDFAFTGDTIFRIARETCGNGLDGLIPPGAMHDMLIEGLAYRRVRKRWPPINDPVPPGEEPIPQPKESVAANRKLIVHVNLFSAANGRQS